MILNLSSDTSSSGTTTCEEPCYMDELIKLDYYHGYLPLNYCSSLLKTKGDFLLLATSLPSGYPSLSLVVKANGLHYFSINRNQYGKFYIYTHHESSIDDLVKYYMEKKSPISKTGIYLLRAVNKPKWMINTETVEVIRKMANGRNTTIYQAESEEHGNVVIKVAPRPVNAELVKTLTDEVHLLKTLKHPNVLKVIGIALTSEPIMVVYEYCRHGSLLHYMNENKKKIRAKDQLGFARGLAKGLLFLHERSIVHGNLCPHTIFLSSHNTPRISGFCKDVDASKMVKWSAPESLECRAISTKSDVYSYGTIIWYIYTEGELPFKFIPDKWVKELTANLKIQLEIPPCVPKSIEQLIAVCWTFRPEDRPTMDHIMDQFFDC